MANRFAVAAGNFNDTATWSTTAAGSPGASVPVAGDNAIANNRTVTITANATCDNITNGTTYGGTAGGGFVLSNGVTLAVLSTVLTGGTGGTIRLTGTDSATITAVSITSANVMNTDCILHSGTGTLIVNGTTVQSFGSSANLSRCINVTASGTLNVTVSTITGGSETVGTTGAIVGSAASNIIVSAASIFGGFALASPALNCAGICSVTGNAFSTVSCHAISVATTTNLTIVGSVSAANGKSTIVGSPTNAIRVSGSFIYSADGTPPTTQKLILNTAPTASKTRYALNGSGTYVDMFTADNTGLAPAVGDVRAGVVYGSATGVLAVPAANSVAFGVPVDNTTGTAVLTPEAVWGHASRTTTGGTVDTLTNAPASVTPNDIWGYATRTLTTSSGPTAVEIRQEIDANSTKLDAAVSSRLASASYTAPTTPPTAAEIATAVEGSLLNEADGQAVLNAIVGAIGNTNLSEVSLVAAIRSDIERSGGKLDAVPSAAANASAVWGTATKTITGGTVDTLTNSPSVPSAASIAAATRSELAVELARVDAAVSSRMAASEATKLDAVKAKTDALNTERLANVATTAIVGNLIAQSQS